MTEGIKEHRMRSHNITHHTCRIPMGNFSVGSVVSHSLKSLCGSLASLRMRSRVLSQEANKWQFCSNTQWPLL